MITIEKHQESDRVNYEVSGITAPNRDEAIQQAAVALAGHRLPTARKAKIYGSFPTNEKHTTWTVMSHHIQRKS